MSSQIAAIKEVEIKDYLVGLFSGGITGASESGGVWTLDLTFDQTNRVASDFPTLAAGDPITIYDTLTYDPSATQFFNQYEISEVVDANTIKIETSDVITTSYNWRLFAGHTQTANPRVYREFENELESKSKFPIIVVKIFKELHNDQAWDSACVRGFFSGISTVAKVDFFQDDRKWSSEAVRKCKVFVDTKSLIMKQNLNFSKITESTRGRFDHFAGKQEAYGNLFFVEIDYNRLEK